MNWPSYANTSSSVINFNCLSVIDYRSIATHSCLLNYFGKNKYVLFFNFLINAAFVVALFCFTFNLKFHLNFICKQFKNIWKHFQHYWLFSMNAFGGEIFFFFFCFSMKKQSTAVEGRRKKKKTQIKRNTEGIYSGPPDIWSIKCCFFFLVRVFLFFFFTQGLKT